MERSTLKRKSHEVTANGFKMIAIECIEEEIKYMFEWTGSLDEDIVVIPLFETKDNMQWGLRLEKIRHKVNRFKIHLFLVNSYESEVDIHFKVMVKQIQQIGSESEDKEIDDPEFRNLFSIRSKVRVGSDMLGERVRFNGDSLSDTEITIRWQITHFKAETNVSENIGKNLIENFKSIINCKEFSDFKIVVKGMDFFVHKNILSARCEYFYTMFRSEMRESTENMIEINDIEVDVFRKFLSFIYTGTAPQIGSNAKELLVCSDFYGITDLKTICEEILCQNFTIESSIDLLLFAIKYNTNKLKERLIDFISNNYSEIRDKCHKSIINLFETEAQVMDIIVNSAMKLCQK